MGHFLANHREFLEGAGGVWLFSAVLSSFSGGMPAPDPSSSIGYRWLYGSLHLFAANVDKVTQAVKPPLA